MWVKTTQEKFEQYGIQIITQRQLADSEYIMHMELTAYPDFFIAIRPDTEVKLFSNEQIETLTADDKGVELDAVKLSEKEQAIISEREAQAMERVSMVSDKIAEVTEMLKE